MLKNLRNIILSFAGLIVLGSISQSCTKDPLVQEIETETVFKGIWKVVSIDYERTNLELGRFANSEFVFSAGDLDIIFDGGAYRCLGFEFDDSTDIIHYDDVFSYGKKDEYNIERSHVSVSDDSMILSGFDWSINLVRIEENENPRLVRIDSEYGTRWAAVNYYLPSGTLWSEDSVLDDALFDASDVDLATVYFGAAWSMPTATQIYELINRCTFYLSNWDGERRVTARRMDGLYMSFPMPSEPNEVCGIWADGYKYAFIYTVDERGAVQAGVTADVEGKQFGIRPVKNK